MKFIDLKNFFDNLTYEKVIMLILIIFLLMYIDKKISINSLVINKNN